MDWPVSLIKFYRVVVSTSFFLHSDWSSHQINCISYRLLQPKFNIQDFKSETQLRSHPLFNICYPELIINILALCFISVQQRITRSLSCHLENEKGKFILIWQVNHKCRVHAELLILKNIFFIFLNQNTFFLSNIYIIFIIIKLIERLIYNLILNFKYKLDKELSWKNFKFKCSIS